MPGVLLCDFPPCSFEAEAVTGPLELGWQVGSSSNSTVSALTVLGL